MLYKSFIGIDPGLSGGAAYLNSCDDYCVVSTFKFTTEGDAKDWLESICAKSPMIIPLGVIEKVHSMPKQGVSSSFKFGENYGFWKGLLSGFNIPYEEISPQRWQKFMSCLTGGDKNISKSRAQSLFPKIKITHSIADALLIAEYGRRKLGLNEDHRQINGRNNSEISEASSGS